MGIPGSLKGFPEYATPDSGPTNNRSKSFAGVAEMVTSAMDF